MIIPQIHTEITDVISRNLEMTLLTLENFQRIKEKKVEK